MILFSNVLYFYLNEIFKIGHFIYCHCRNLVEMLKYFWNKILISRRQPIGKRVMCQDLIRIDFFFWVNRFIYHKVGL